MTSPLHVAVVTEIFPPEVNGVAMTRGRMVQGLLARGHRVSLVRARQHAADTGDVTAAPCSVAALDREHIHEQLVATLRDAIARPALPPEGGAVYRFLADQ